MDSQNIATNNQQGLGALIELIKTLWEKRKIFYWVVPITFVVSSAIILCVPRTYTCQVILAPEIQGGRSSGSLQALASSFGLDMQSASETDAIYPLLYPEVVGSPNFLVRLFDTQVETEDGEFNGTYYKYLSEVHHGPFWNRWKAKIKAVIAPTEENPLNWRKPGKDVDVFCLSKKQWYAIKIMQDNITCEVDKKTEVIKFSVVAQDKLVCAIMADSVCAAMQQFITTYRTQKARTDISYYEEVVEDAQKEYKAASERYIRYVDGHSGMKLEQHRLEAQNLEVEMRIKQSAYTSFQKQLLATQARLQENTPVFTVLQSGSIPLRASGPKRTIFVLAMLILASGITACVVCKDQLMAMLTSGGDED